jgi:hypothetical protein
MATADKEYNDTFNQIKDQAPTDPNDKSSPADASMQLYQSPIADKMNQEWEMAEKAKIYDEERFIKSLRQYRGQYDPEILKKIHPNRSKANIRLTRTKVKTYDARMMDIKFPANEDNDWNLQNTPVPELSPEVVQQIAAQMFEQTGKTPTRDEMQMIIYDIAATSAAAMEKEISDQLAEFDYRSVIRDVIHSGHVFGTGILKGPLVKEIVSKRWHQTPKGWQQIKIKRLVPIAQHVPVWDIYPDKSAKDPKDCRYVWQKHLFSKNNLYKLALRSDFDGAVIKEFIKCYPQGNAEYKRYESELRDMSSNNKDGAGEDQPPKLEKYELHERWGFISVEDAKELIPDVSDDVWNTMGPEVALNLWLIDKYIIKAIVSPIEGAEIPYYFYYFDKDETSIFGDGIPEIMRDPAMMYNASIRAMIDNAAISAGPIIEANIDLLADGEDPTKLFPFRVFQRIGSGIEAGQQAIRVTNLPSYTMEFLGLVEFFQGTADESTTIPRSLSGVSDGGQSGAAKTATGMSMLIGASNITLKDQVHYMDEGVTRKFIRAMYFWNMEFNPKEEIKGDYNVIARGSKSLIAKEVKMEQINQFLQITGNDLDAKYIKRDVLLRELAEIFDLDKLGFVRTKEEVDQAEAQEQEGMKRQQDMEMILEAMKAESSGHVPDAVKRTAQMFNIQLPGGAEGIEPRSVQGGQLG